MEENGSTRLPGTEEGCKSRRSKGWNAKGTRVEVRTVGIGEPPAVVRMGTNRWSKLVLGFRRDSRDRLVAMGGKVLVLVLVLGVHDDRKPMHGQES